MSDSWRVFCAIELPDEVRAQLRDHSQQLRTTFGDAAASWTRVENIHLTLKFFGNIAIDRLPAISAAASRTAKEFSKFQITIGSTGVFPRPSRAQVLWIGVNDTEGKLTGVQKGLEEDFASEGFEKEDRAYKPHLTIARIRKQDGARKLAEAHLQMNFPDIEIDVTEFVVFRSELSSKGSRYTPLSHHVFQSVTSA
jgi:RNA 2',3'-cyclic 3'-phosphodiesterase